MKRTEEEDEEEARRDDEKKKYLGFEKNTVHFFLSSMKFVSQNSILAFSFVSSSSSS